MNKQNILIVIFLAILAVAVGLATISPSVVSAAPNRPPRIDVVQDGWEYHAIFDQASGTINANSDFQWGTAASVAPSIAAHQRLARRFAQHGIDIEGTIVFRRPFSQVEFEQFVSDTQIEVVDYIIRFVDAHGQRVTIFGTPDDGQLVPQADLDFALNDLAERDQGAIAGWVEVRGKIPAASYHIVESNPDVYFVDVTRTAIQAAFKGQPNADKAALELIEPQVYWKLEDLGLVKTK